MATLNEVYCKFGETAEAAQILETQLGTMLLTLNASAENLFEAKNPERAAEILDGVNRNTLGQLLKRLGKTTDFLDSLESQLVQALGERNRLSHMFYRQHNLRRNSEEGRDIMLRDLEQMHSTLLNAYKSVMLLNGIDLDAMVATSSGAPEQAQLVNLPKLPKRHLPLMYPDDNGGS
jgi:hypothetical protein